MKFRSPVTRPLHPAPWAEYGAKRGQIGYPQYDFRVTQGFGSLDGYFKGQAHGAVDIGNTRCGDPVVAMQAGILRRMTDGAKAAGLAATDALGAAIDHGNGISTEYWHLDGYAGPASGRVEQGQQIGVVGDTGIGAVCHLHVEAKRNGVRFDPEPLMFGGSVSIEMEDDMAVPARLSALAFAALGANNRIRATPSITAPFVTVTDQTTVQVFGKVEGGAWKVGTVSGTDWYWIGYGLNSGFVATILLPNVGLTALGRDTLPALTPPPADCTDEVAAAVDASEKRWKEWLGQSPK